MIGDIRASLEKDGLEGAAISEKIETMRVVGQIPPYDYTVPILVLVVLGVVSIYLAYKLKRADSEQGYGLENPGARQ